MEERSPEIAPSRPPALLITADDYGYAPAYDAGILDAGRAGAIDAVSVMAMREPDPAPLLAIGVAIGLHLEPLTAVSLERQLAEFERRFHRSPSHLDGHKHCHAEPGGPALEVAELARRLRIPVRPVNAPHRRILRSQGIGTPDRLLGRTGEDEPALPPEIAAWLEGRPPAGVSEWMVHPGRAEPAVGSSYDRGRAEDLELLLRLAGEPRLVAARGSHAELLGRSSAEGGVR